MVRRIPTLLAAVVALSAVAVVALTGAAQAHSFGLLYRLKATFQVPVPPDAIQNGWCYDLATVDPFTHRLYLSDAANRQLTVIDPATSAISGIGTGLFTGIGGCHEFDYDQQGPNGSAIYDGDIYAGNGDSHVLGFSLRSGNLIADVNTGGALRADEMTVAGHELVVANPAETPSPYISFINLANPAHPIDGKFTFADAIGGLEQSQVWAGHLYISVPQTTQDPNGGEVDELDISHLDHVRIIRRFPFATCQPAGLSVRFDGLAAVGCGGPANTNAEILNLITGQQTPVANVPGVDQVAASWPDFFYVSYDLAQFVVADSSGNVLQRFPATSASHTVAVDPFNLNVWVPQDKGQVNLYSPW
jgi:hypothetical protein